MPAFDADIAFELVKHLFVRVSGYLEVSFKLMVRKYADKRKLSIDNLSDYLYSKEFQRGFNAWWDRIEQIIGYFTDNAKKDLATWSDTFSKTNSITIKRVVDDVVTVRNQVAHDGNILPNITYVDFATIEIYYSYIKSLVAKIYAIFQTLP